MPAPLAACSRLIRPRSLRDQDQTSSPDTLRSRHRTFFDTLAWTDAQVPQSARHAALAGLSKKGVT
jgi:hypothetical protein